MGELRILFTGVGRRVELVQAFRQAGLVLNQKVIIYGADMSIVGPRPLLVKYLPLYNEEQRHRHSVRPGLTGYAQVHGRNDTSWSNRFKNDVYYVKNVSLLLDISIIKETIMIVLKREGINTEETSKFTMFEFTGEEEEN